VRDIMAKLREETGEARSWGKHRLLRCSKDGASASASASPPPHPQTPSPEMENHQGWQGSLGAAAGASQPPRPSNLRTQRSATDAQPHCTCPRCGAR
jgi:hypothetical protein